MIGPLGLPRLLPRLSTQAEDVEVLGWECGIELIVTEGEALWTWGRWEMWAVVGSA